VRRGKRLNVEYVDRRAGRFAVLQNADKACSRDDRARATLGGFNQAVPQSISSADSHQAARTAANTKWDRSGCRRSNSLVPGNQDCASAVARGVMSGSKHQSLQRRSQSAQPSIQTAKSQNALVCPRRYPAHCCCQTPDRMELLSVTMMSPEGKDQRQVIRSSGPTLPRL